MSAVQDLKQRRASLAQQITEIDAVLRQLGASGAARSRSRSTGGAVDTARSEAAKKMWAERRAAAANKTTKAAKPTVAPKPKNKLQAARAARAPLQAVSKPASLAAAAEG